MIQIQLPEFMKWLRVVLIVLIVATVLFIWINSTVPPEESSKQSSAVQDFVEEVIPDEVTFKDFIIENIRKIGHFTEYGLLAIIVAVYVFIFHFKKLAYAIPLSMLLPFAVGFLDESIQQFSGRGPSITDVWIDVGGFAAFTLLTYGICALSYFVKCHIKKQLLKKKKEM